MKLLKDMIKIDILNIFELSDNNIGVCFEHFAEMKEGNFLITVKGEGTTLEDAVRDYARKISGRTLVANPTSSNRKEITVLLVEDEKWLNCYNTIYGEGEE